MGKTSLTNIQGLAEANLKDADLEGATGLLGNEFAQADVTGTRLPADIKEFKALETIEKTSQNARKIFFAMLLSCVYSWLTIATTTDVRLLTNTASSPLPIIGTEIPIAWFYIAAPLVLLSLYLYFHFYMQGLWESLAGLPAVFPDGKNLVERVYPWLLNRLVRRHFRRLKTDRPLRVHLQDLVVIILAWFVVPFTMLGFWFRFLSRHDWIGTCLHIVLIAFTVAAGCIFFRLYALTLQGKEDIAYRIKNFHNDRRSKYGIFIIGLIIFVISYSIAAFFFTGADFQEKIVSEIPDNYWEISEGRQLNSVKGANLRKQNLRNADMHRSFLVKAELRSADLRNASLSLANLQNADLKNAQLQNTNLFNTNLHNADLAFAELQHANLTQADLRGVDFIKANLKSATLVRAKLQDARFTEANLQDADLSEADLTGAKSLDSSQLSKAKSLYKTKMDSKLYNEIKTLDPKLLDKSSNR